MRLSSAWASITRFLLTTLVLVPVGALILGAIIDRGPKGEARVTAISLALAASDPSAREAVLNSLMLATAVASGSLLLGVGLAQMDVRGRLIGSGILASLARIPGTVPPLFAALGLISFLKVSPAAFQRFSPWLALVWVELAWGVARVMSAVVPALERINPSWQDAAKMAGAGRIRRWREIVWPLVRPTVARSLVEVFAVVLMEPGAPLILGARRTLAYQAVDAALQGERLERAAVLGVIGLVLVLVARTLLLWWGEPGPRFLPPLTDRRRSRTAWPLASGAAICLALWVALVLVPFVGLGLTAVSASRIRSDPSNLLGGLLPDANSGMLLVHSLILGSVVTVMGAILSSGAASSRRLRLGVTVPPLAIGLGAILIPSLLNGLAERVGSPRIVTAIRFVCDTLDPYTSPGVLLAIAVLTVRLPDFSRVRDKREADQIVRCVETARTLGASSGEAWLMGFSERSLRQVLGLWIWVFALAAIDCGPALLLTPTDSARTIGPGLLLLASEPDGLRRASALAILALLLPLAAVMLSGWTRVGSGVWARLKARVPKR